MCLQSLVLLGLLSGCKRFHQQQQDMVYVAARRLFLRDRVAPVSERVVEVTNGQALKVVEHGARFYKVKTAGGQMGWIEEHAVIDSKTYAAFEQLAKDHQKDPLVSMATLRDDLYMHVAPGRDTDHFYLLPGNSQVQMLERASVERQLPSYMGPPRSAGKDEQSGPPTVMEDWWLVRDSQGHTGWMLGSRLDVNAPDDILGYCEGQRVVGAWKLATVTDPEAPSPNHEMTEYLTALEPPKSGLPFDFDQIRVFTWSVKHHRYETGFRLHPIQGFLPVLLSQDTVNGRTVPVFSFQIPSSQDVKTDPATGVTRPVNPRTIRYALIDTTIKRIGPDLAPLPSSREKDQKKTDVAPRKPHRRR